MFATRTLQQTTTRALVALFRISVVSTTPRKSSRWNLYPAQSHLDSNLAACESQQGVALVLMSPTISMIVVMFSWSCCSTTVCAACAAVVVTGGAAGTAYMPPIA